MNYNYFAQQKQTNEQNIQSNLNFSNNINAVPFENFDSGMKILQKVHQNDDEKLPILSVIVTFRSGCSYDNLFNQVRQVPPEGGRITLYEANLDSIDKLYSYLSGEVSSDKISDETLKKTVSELLHEISDIEPDCVLFNFECSSGCAGQTFSKKDATMKTVKFILDKGSMVMFSDFAVKALIHQWDENLLGSNPFIKLGECSSSIFLAFKPEKLINSPSAQLKMVGELSSKGECHIHALSQTIVFGVDMRKADYAKYDLDVLTIVTKTHGFNIHDEKNNSYLSEVDNKKGSVGHALIKYKSSKGILLISAGHWIELSKLDVDVTKLESIAENVGGEYYNQMMNIKTANISEGEKFCQYENLANLYVQQSAPCNYSKKANVGFLNKTKLNQEKMLYPEQEVEKGIENLEIKNEEIFKPQKFDENENLQD
jgi:hypothetical protein